MVGETGWRLKSPMGLMFEGVRLLCCYCLVQNVLEEHDQPNAGSEREKQL